MNEGIEDDTLKKGAQVSTNESIKAWYVYSFNGLFSPVFPLFPRRTATHEKKNVHIKTLTCVHIKRRTKKKKKRDKYTILNECEGSKILWKSLYNFLANASGDFIINSIFKQINLLHIHNYIKKKSLRNNYHHTLNVYLKKMF